MISFAPTILLAIDVNGLLSILFILFSLIVYVINQVAAKGQEAAKKNQPRPRPAPAANDPSEDEIEAFLRRASRKRAENEPGARPQQQQPQRQPQRQAFGGQPLPSQQQRPGQRQPQRRGTPQRPMRPGQAAPGSLLGDALAPGPAPGGLSSAPVQGRVIAPASAQSPQSSSLSDQLQQRASFSSFDAPSTNFPALHSSLEQVDEATEARLHSTFDHALGSLGTGLLSSSDDDLVYGSTITDSSQPTEQQPVQRGSIVDMLRSPQGIRDAIVMQEILKPRSLD